MKKANLESNLRKVRAISRKKSEINNERGRELKKTFVLVDTNFILTCVKQKIDFFEWFKLQGISIIIPLEVINELKMLEHRKKNVLALEAKLALKLLKKNKFRKIDLQGGDKADREIVRYAKQHPEIIIATLDREMKRKIKNRIITIRRGKMLEIQ